METKNVSLTKHEAQVLINLIDIAIKAKGLEAAEAGVHFTKKIEEAFKQEEVNSELVKVEESK